MRRKSIGVALVALGMMPAAVQAQEGPVEQAPVEQSPVEQAPVEQAGPQSDDSPRAVRVPTIQVIGEAPEAVEGVPGSATVITEEDIEQQAPLSINEALRTAPGVHVRDEEGIGLRPNIGFRGLDPTRSRNVLILEDGAPQALAPYGEPEMYYAPQIERMERIEIVKGSGSILFGPQTIGGVINFITPPPPEEFTVNTDLRVGNHGYYMGQVSVGDTIGDFGYRLGAMHLRYEGPRALNLELTDITAKLAYRISQTSNVSLKLQFYDEFANVSYLGLTTPQYEHDPHANYAIYDELPIRRYAFALNYDTMLSPTMLLQTIVYGHNIARNFARQDFDREPVDGRTYERIIGGQGQDLLASSLRPTDRSAIYFRDTISSRDREFFIGGIEPRLIFDLEYGGIQHELTVGTRLHVEHADEQFVIKPVPGAAGERVVRDAENRQGYAVAGYVLNRFTFADRFRVSPGVRIENVWYDREITRARVEGVPTDLDEPITNDSYTMAVIPGVGLSYSLLDGLTVFGGLHRGFAPPRTKDSIRPDGEALDLDAEYSWNYEVGVRGHVQDFLYGEVTGFYLDFSNQIIPPSEAGGATTDVALLNSGETRHLGVETSLTFDPAALAGFGFALPLSVSYTYVDATFGDGWTENISGNRLPYAPEHQLYGQLRFVHPTGLSAQLGALYISEQYADKQNTELASVDGLVGTIDSHFVLDARVAYTIPGIGLTAFVSGKNLLDEPFVASRAPTGIMPGGFRQVFGGLQGEW